MPTDKFIDHLFRHQHGKMVSSLTRIFGTSNIELVEDVVQDTFQKATLYFRNNDIPENPEAWLRKVARNRAIDLLRQGKAKSNIEMTFASGPSTIAFDEVFSEHEVEDNQLRLLFTVCHPAIKLQDQIVFALKTFSGFSRKEISTSLLKSEESIKKSLARARKSIVEKEIKFEVPEKKDLINRLDQVHMVLYLLFNEGFHSSNKKTLVRKDLVAEALRLNGLLIERFQNPDSKALMALMCFHSARLDSKITETQKLIKLKDQDRGLWNYALILKGHEYLTEAIKDDSYSRFHWEAAIAGEYVQSANFENTNWANLEIYYNNLIALIPSAFNKLNLCVILLQQNKSSSSEALFDSLNPNEMQGRIYLYSSVGSEIQAKLGYNAKALEFLNNALEQVENESEKELIKTKISKLK